MMNIHSADLTEVRLSLANKVLWAVFLVYLGVSGFAMAHHELWMDEVHSWNIAKGSASFSDLITNTRYEGHPPGWYTVLWVLSKFTHRVAYMQGVQWVIACSVVFMVLFLSPLPLMTKVLLPFGYYFIYEYAVFSRNYALGILLACAVCFVMKKEFTFKLFAYYVLIFCLSNIHLLALLLAGSLHLYFLLMNWEQKKRRSILFFHALLGLLVSLPAIYCIFPPSEGQQNVHFWLGNWSLSHQLTDFSNTPLRSFMPIPSWWAYHFWNTQFLLDVRNSLRVLKFINPLISLALLSAAFFILGKNKKSLVLFSANIVFSLILTIGAFSLTAARHAGFIFIGFVAAYWLFCYERPLTKTTKWLVNSLLVLQLIAGVYPLLQDIRYPFSNLYRVNELIKEVPVDEKIVSSYWAMNGVVAFTDKPAYCIDLQEEKSFLLFDDAIAAMQNKPDRYLDGVKNIFQQKGIKSIYMISTDPPEILFQTDPGLPKSFRVTLADKIEGAIEKGSNLYLYKITTL